MDKVFISALQVPTVIGVYDWEKQIQQTLVFDIELRTDIRQAAATDDLHYTIDYAAVCQAVTELCAEPHQLLETVAEKTASMILQNFPTQAVRVRIGKPGAVPQAASVGVMIERGDW
ncbi:MULTISPECIES: dihydroneopterin aldolase [Rheinheimera]|uniref:7,8-dihydroneopterin aldolase n=1 Tax=Rheinheimera marina TaxID=1774958 RepID=A0ABV9JS96_9GAMM